MSEDLDELFADGIREFELGGLRRQQHSEAEREQLLTETLGRKIAVPRGEVFAIGDESAGITAKSVWFQGRRIHFAVIVSVAVGELRTSDQFSYCIDLNCTARRAYRINVKTVIESDNFLVELSNFMSLKIVPTAEEEMRQQLRTAELAAANESNIVQRQRRMEYFAARQQELLSELIQIECAPKVSFGIIY